MAIQIDPRSLNATPLAAGDATPEVQAETQADAPAQASQVQARLAQDPAGASSAQAAVAVPAINSEAPALPLAKEAPASVGETRSAVVGMADNLSDYSAFALIQQGQMKALQIAGNMRRAAQLGVINESMNAVKDLVAQIAGEQKGAVLKLVGASLGAATSASAGMSGAMLRRSNADGQAAAGAALDGSAQQLGGVVSSLVDMSDKLGGGTHQADMARIAQREDDVRKSIAQQVLDSARSAYDQADKTLSNAMQSFSDYFKRKEGLMGNIANQ